jgi:hypothetical protein
MDANPWVVHWPHLNVQRHVGQPLNKNGQRAGSVATAEFMLALTDDQDPH